MKHSIGLRLAALATILASSAALSAGPIEDARAALQDKKYGEVDKLLEKLLAQKQPPLEALQISLDASVAAGRYVTAQKRITLILRESPQPDFLFRGAQIAERAGGLNLALARYLTYAKQTQPKAARGEPSDKLKEALAALIRQNTYADEFRRYAQLFGADGTAWAFGWALVDRLFQAGEPEKAVEIAGALIQLFPDPEHVSAVHRRIKYASDKRELGSGDQEAYLVPLLAMVKGVPYDFGDVSQMFSNATRVMPAEQQVDVAFVVQGQAKGPLDWGLLSRFAAMRSLANDDARFQAGRKFLALEPLYRNSPNLQDYAYYLGLIAESPQVFNIKDKALLSPSDLTSRFDALKARPGIDEPTLNNLIGNIRNNWLAPDPPAQIVFLRKHITLLDTARFEDLLNLVQGKDFETLLAEAVKGRSASATLDLRVRALRWYAEAKNKDKLLEIARDTMSAFPGSFDWARVRNYVFDSPAVDMDSKLALLQDIAGKAGYSLHLRDLMRSLARERGGNRDWKSWSENPKFDALSTDFETQKPGTDPFMRAHVLLCTTRQDQNQARPELQAACEEFLKAWQGQVPGGWDQTKSARDVLAVDVFSRHLGHVWNNRKALCAAAVLWAPRLGLGPSWPWMTTRVLQHGATASVYDLAPHYIALCAGNEKGDPEEWSLLKQAANPQTDKKSLFAPVTDKMGAENALYYVSHQESFTDPKFVLAELARIAAQPGFKFTDRNLVNHLIHAVTNRTSPEVQPDLALTRALWTAYLAAEDATGRYNPFTENYVYGHYLKAGREKEADEHLAAYFEAIKKRTLPQQIDALTNVYGSIPREADQTLKPRQRLHTLLNVLGPLYQKVRRDDWPDCTVHSAILDDLSDIAGNWPDGDGKSRALALMRLQLDMILAGARQAGQGNSLYAPLERRIAEALDAADWPLVSDLTRYYAETLRYDGDWDRNYTARIQPLVDKLEAKGAHEIVYVFLGEVEKRNRPSDTVSKQIAILKSKVAREIPGFLAVDRSDPAYDLYIAAEALALGNETRAWELTAPRLKLLPATWLKLDPDYVAWSVDQMRKQKLLKEALELAFTILLREFDLDPDLAARLSLTKGDIYRDMQNYQAAKIEYEGIKNNSRYSKTDAGAKARYRLIDLLIMTKDYATAEGLLERLVESDRLDTQAEAYYLYARIAYDQADYPQAKEYLKEVFKRKHDHVEARLLEGELKLLVPRGLASTEVLVGNPMLRTIAIPGRPLTLQLQDSNLSIARGGAAIPVVVTTSRGGDVENVKLLPSASDKNLFTGTIATSLGKVEKNDLQLELRGDDVVSYIIDPAFQKANELDYPAKTLEVKYDARLVASAGEILTEEEAEKRALEQRLQAARGDTTSRRFEGRTGHTVRPGSPIYIQVVDLDRDMTDAPDKVAVALKTLSGDSLDRFDLTETGPHTGIFRGAAPTGIPFPRASASDTEEGKDPSVMINSTKPGLWASLPDGRAPKWVEVDTMSSENVKTASIEMPNRAAIRQVTLMGELADEYEMLASFPKGLRGSGQGLTGEYYSGIEFNRKRFVRVDPKISFDFTRQRPGPQLGGTNISVRWTGQVQPKFSETYTFYTLSDDGVRLFVDGKKIIENWSLHAAAEDKATVALEVGKKYDIKLEYYQGDGDAAIGLLWSSKSQKKEIIPPAQLYPLASDAAPPKPLEEIAPTDTGFTVTLPEPKRLRKLRWVFEEFDGNQIAVKELSVKDAAGKALVPVKVDFSTGTTNTTLEIAPGDRIEVTYADEKRTQNESPVLHANLDSSYYNGTITLANEVIEDREGGGGQGLPERFTRYEPARRCRQGDQLMVVLTDYDEDLTDERDTVAVQARTSSGEKLELKALETWINDPEGERHKHSGVFLGVLRIGSQTAKDTIKVAPGDTITVGYLDKENTLPGVPYERTYTVAEAGKSKPRLVLYRTTVQLVEDKSEAAEIKRRQLRMRGKPTEGMVITKEQIVARHPDYQEQAAVGSGQSAVKKEEEKPPTAETRNPEPAVRNPEIAVSVSAPLLFEVSYPKMALNAGSVLSVTAAAESERKAAGQANRKPAELKVPTYIKGIDQVARDKGYAIQLLTPAHRTEEEMLDEGCFAGVVRLQIGSPGDPVDDLVVAGGREFETARSKTEDDYRFRVPTLVVSGSDVVVLTIKDAETGEEAVTRVRLLSDARLELLDNTYTAQKDTIHLGEKFYVKVTDPDHDTTDQQDAVTVKVAAASGDSLALELKESLPHSGIFTGSFKPEFAGEKVEGKEPKADPADGVLSVTFGDEVTFTYTDATSLASAGPMDVVAKAKVHFGSDGELAGFTKSFKDPEMAVKTRFLMAEALFEMAKEHRKLKQNSVADEEIARGKRILEEAMRDYPNTSLAAQGEFLLANLAQELGNHQEAIGRYSNIISNWPDSEYAPRSQFKKAICLEKMESYDQACEEYVKLTYIYPESSLVADATIRLGNYYYNQKAYKVAGRIFYQFQQRNPTHALAVKSLFLSAQCFMKMEDFKESIRLFSLLIDEYIDDKEVRSEAMYWLGDSYYKARDYKKAYQGFKKLTWDYPETKWAKIARGRLTEDVLAQEEEREGQ